MVAQKKLLVFGGAFNPPHKGHELLFKTALDTVQPDLALVIPSGTSPHKRGGDVAFARRAAMCRCFLRAGAQVKISGLENRGKKQRGYTIKTLKHLKKKYPGYELYLLVGGDMLLTFDKWKSYRRLLSLATVVAGMRVRGEEQAVLEKKQQLERLGANIVLLNINPVEISSSTLRALLREEGDVAQYLSGDVLDYAVRHKLYI